MLLLHKSNISHENDRSYFFISRDVEYKQYHIFKWLIENNCDHDSYLHIYDVVLKFNTDKK